MSGMAQSGLDHILQDRVAVGSLIYGGWSAGAVVAGRSLRDWAWSISDHPEAEAAARTAAWLTEQGLPFGVPRDGEVIIA